MQKAYIKTASVVLFLILGMQSLQAGECERSLKQLKSEAASFSEMSVPEKTNFLVDGLTNLIESNNRLTASKSIRGVPSEKQLRDELRISKKDLEAFYAFRTSASNFEDLIKLSQSRYPLVYEKLRGFAAGKLATLFAAKIRYVSPEELGMEFSLENWERDLEILYGDYSKLIELAKTSYPKSIQVARERLARAYANVAKKFRRSPKEEEVAEELGMTHSDFLALLGPKGLVADIETLKRLAREQSPASFRNVVDTDVLGDEAMQAFLDAVKLKGGVLVTSAVAGDKVDRHALMALKTMAKERNLVIAVLPINMQTDGLDSILVEDPDIHVLTQTAALTPYLRIDRLKVTAKQMNPLTSTDRIGNRNETILFGSPKMFLKSNAIGDQMGYPRRLVSTGSITQFNYNSQHYIGLRTDEIAEHDHMIGGVILEKQNGRADFLGDPEYGGFHLRHLEYIPERQGFYDIATRSFYAADGSVKVEAPEAIIYEPHVGQHYESMMPGLARLIAESHPKEVIGHDVFNGHSVSHHDRKSPSYMAKKADEGKLNLRTEIRQLAAHINAVLRLDENLQYVIVPANHNEWLKRYLESKEWQLDPENMTYASELHFAMVSGTDPLEYALLYSPMRTPGDYGPEKPALIDEPHRVTYINPSGDHNHRIGPDNRLVSVGHHGDRGSNGSRGSIKQFQDGLDRAVWGHSHNDQRRNGHVQIGTASALSMGYNTGGLSSWWNSIGVVGPNGEIQSLNWIDSEFHRPDGEQVVDADKFWRPGYPQIIKSGENYDPEQGPGKGQIDQYSTKKD